MRFMSYAASIALTLFPLSVEAQCFNRTQCPDPSTLVVQSQISLNIPVADQAAPADTLKAVETAERDLFALSKRECDTLKEAFGGDCSLSPVNINRSVQDRGINNKSAFVSMSNTYQLKKLQK
jgi:hypothetical protein